MLEIKNGRGLTLFKSFFDSLPEAVEEAVRCKVSLRGAVLPGVNLNGRNLVGARLSYADLRGARLSLARLDRASLEGANLQNANFYGASMTKTDLTMAKLWGVDLGVVPGVERVNLYRAWFTPSPERRTLALDAGPSGRGWLIPTEDDWWMALGCWTPHRLSDLEDLIEDRAEWPEAQGEERERRRPYLRAILAQCRAHIAYCER